MHAAKSLVQSERLLADAGSLYTYVQKKKLVCKQRVMMVLIRFGISCVWRVCVHALFLGMIPIDNPAFQHYQSVAILNLTWHQLCGDYGTENMYIERQPYVPGTNEGKMWRKRLLWNVN